MASNPRPARRRRSMGRIARTGASFALAGTFALALPVLGTITATGRGIAPVAAAEDVRLDKGSIPVRIQVPSAGIDLPVVSSQRTVPGNAGSYPLCDVAQYWTIYDLPGKPGTAWIYAHAQPGMFLPLFTISEATNGQGLIGDKVKLQLKDGRLLTYRITEVRERATRRSIAQRDKPNEHRLVLQTSTGPPGTVPKLQVAAKLVDATRTDAKPPRAQPRACWQPKPRPTRKGAKPRPTPEPVEVVEPGEPFDAMALVLGSGAVLIGATIVSVYIIRRGP